MAKKKNEQRAKGMPRKSEQRPKERRGKRGESMEAYLQPDDEHFVSFKNQLAVMGLMLRDIPGDGNCLFRALGDQLEGHSRNHLRLRQETVQFMLAHREDFEPFVEDDVPFAEHINQLQQPGTYGGHDVLVAFARMRQLNIVIHQLNSPLWQIEGATANARQLHLSYHNGEHYSSVRLMGDASETPANVKINIEMEETTSNTYNENNNVVCDQFKSETDEDQLLDSMHNVSARTGCKDYSLIQEALTENNLMEDAAVDYIFSVMVFTETSDTVDDTDSLIASASLPTGILPEASVSKSELVSSMPKKMTTRQKKEKRRLEKMLQRQAKNAAPPPANPVAEQCDASVEARFSCLRI